MKQEIQSQPKVDYHNNNLQKKKMFKSELANLIRVSLPKTEDLGFIIIHTNRILQFRIERSLGHCYSYRRSQNCKCYTQPTI